MTRSNPYFYSSNYQTGNRRSTIQRGYGLGGFLKGLARSFASVLKRELVRVGKKESC